MFMGKPDNISIKQARMYTTIQLDIIHTGDCLKIPKTLPDDSVQGHDRHSVDAGVCPPRYRLVSAQRHHLDEG